MKQTHKVFVKGKPITLTKNHYKAQGGEGAIYHLNGMAYKIYHDAQKTIPEAKIHDLSGINSPNILNPRDVIYDAKNMPIGFTMPFASDTEFLKRMIVRTFKNKVGITDNDIHELNIKLQQVLSLIHTNNLLVCDYNEMNILIDKKDYITPYHIDVDSWATKNYRATAIMETVRDVSVPFGTFNELTDWYSFAVITFQLYTGVHPYRDGRHPNYTPKTWIKRAENCISVFENNVTLPKKDFSMIPKIQLDWYKFIFKDGKRDLPPNMAGLTVGQIQSTVIVSHGDFIINKLKEYDDTIRNIYYYNGKRYVVTNKSIVKNDNIIFGFRSVIKGHFLELAECPNEEPIIAVLSKDEINFIDLNRNPIGSIHANDLMEYNGAIYSVDNGELCESTFEKFGKIQHKVDTISSIYESAYKMFKGVVIQDIIGKCWMAVPFEIGSCTNLHISELDGTKIIDAKHNKGVCIVIHEKNKKYYRSIIFFGKQFDTYTINTEETNSSDISFIRLPNDICVLSEDQKLLLFCNNKQKKEIGNSPIDATAILHHHHNNVQFSSDNKLYSLKLRS